MKGEVPAPLYPSPPLEIATTRRPGISYSRLGRFYKRS